jgi:GT2 family glycosyltransferase
MNTSTHPPADLSVSIVLHNSSLALLSAALRSLRRAAQYAHDAGELARLTVWLVDNASDERYRSTLKAELMHWAPREYFDVQYIPQARNRGFGCGHNAVLSQLTSDFHLVLNPDVELQVDALQVGLASLRRGEDIVLLSPKVLGGQGEQEFLCKRYPSVLVLFLRGFAPAALRRLFRRRLAGYEMRDVCSGEMPADVDIASGCFMLTRTTALRAVGGFNENFFLYFEDFDLSLRLAKQGRLVFDPRMRIVHHGGYAANKGRAHVKYFIRSGIRFFNRHGWRLI